MVLERNFKWRVKIFSDLLLVARSSGVNYYATKRYDLRHPCSQILLDD